MPEQQGRAIAHTTYIRFAKKYKIPLVHSNGKTKTFPELAKEIYNYEMKHIWPAPRKYGLYVVKYFFSVNPVNI